MRQATDQLVVGKLHFCIAAGGAHVYEVIQDNWEELLQCEPKLNMEPHLVIEKRPEGSMVESLYEIARNYERNRDGTVDTTICIEDYDESACHPAMKVKQAL
jgi:hypothetical protein